MIMMKQSLIEKIQDILLIEPSHKNQLIKVIRSAQQNDLIEADALLMIEGVLSLSDLKVRDIMVSRSKMITVSEDQCLTEILEIVTESGHSRFPITDEDQNSIVGILHAKDLLMFYKHEDPHAAFDIKEIQRQALFIPESKEVSSLLKDFRINKNHMAVIIDEYGNASGFITIEDILEKIVGDIEDEFDSDPDTFIKETKPNQFVVQAVTPIEEFNEYFDCALDNSEFDTIGGLVSQAFGHVPDINEEIVLIDTFKIKVVGADKRKLESIEVTRV